MRIVVKLEEIETVESSSRCVAVTCLIWPDLAQQGGNHKQTAGGQDRPGLVPPGETLIPLRLDALRLILQVIYLRQVVRSMHSCCLSHLDMLLAHVHGDTNRWAQI